MADNCNYRIDRSNLHNVRKQASGYLCDLDERVTTLELSPDGGIALDYLYDIELTGDPLSGHAAANTLDPTTVTELRLSKTTEGGNDAAIILADINVGDIVAYFQDDPPNNTSYYEVTGAAVDSGTYFTVSVVWFSSVGAALPSVDDAPMTVHIVQKVIRYHDDLLDVTPDQHHREIHKLYGTDADGVNQHEDVDITDALETRDLLAIPSGSTLFKPETRMNWRDVWQPTTYYVHDVVLDSPYTMVANKTTTDRAAPQNVGDPTWDFPDAPLWTDFSQTALVGSGHTYTFNETVYLNSVRVWIPAEGVGIYYRLRSLSDGNYQSRLLTGLVADEWNIIGVDSLLVAAGSELLIYLESQNSGGTTTVTGGWTRGTNSNDVEPANQSWNQNNARSILRIDFDDLDAVDRQTELEGIITGSVISIAQTSDSSKNTEYQVLANPVTRITCVEYQVAVIGEGAAPPDIGQTCTVTADVPIAQPTDFVGIPNGWTGNQPLWGSVESFLAYDGVDQGAAPDNQYGIDINVQRLTISPDWDLLALSGGGGGGSGDFTPTVFAGAGTTGYVPDPITEQNFYLKDDGTFADPTGGTGAGYWTLNGDDIYNNNVGNVGIGTTSPQELQHIYRGSLTLGAATLYGNESTGATVGDGFYVGYSVAAYLWNYEATDTIFATNNAERMRIDPAGNVGIGTSDVLSKLHVVGNAGVPLEWSSVGSQVAMFDNNGLASGNCSINVVASPAGGSTYSYSSTAIQQAFKTQFNHLTSKFQFVVAGTLFPADATPMTIDALTGYVGIGTESPDTKLHIESASSNVAIVGSTGTQSRLVFRNSSVTGYETYLNANFANFAFIVGSSERMRITSAGNVGIGTTSPTSRLDIDSPEFTNTQFMRDGTVGLQVQVDGSYHGYIKAPNNLLTIAGLSSIFYAGGVERARILSTGKFLVGRTAQQHGTPHFDTIGSMNATNGIYVQDTRAWANPPPDPSEPSNYPLDRSALFLFENTIPTGRVWDSTITVQGWTGSYDKWQLIGPANNLSDPLSDLANKWFLRVGNNTHGWGALNEVAHSGNIDTIGHWATSGDNIYNNNGGNVGISTSAPTQARLHLVGSTSLVNDIRVQSGVPNNSTFGAIEVRNTNANASGQSYPFLTAIADSYNGSVGIGFARGTVSSRSDLVFYRGISGLSEGARLTWNGILNVGSPTAGSVSSGSVNITGNYFINGIPISTFIDAPSDGNIYGRKNAAWTSLGSGTGTVSDLASSPSATNVVITNTGGNNATIAAASATIAGVMTTSDKNKLDGIADNANNYVHPTYAGDDASIDTGTLSGAQVISRVDFNVTTDTLGHVTDCNGVETVRTLTAADIGAADTQNEFLPAISTPSFVGASTGGSGISGSIRFVYNADGFVIMTGRINWSTAPTGTGQIRIDTGAVNCTLSTGWGFSGSNVENQANAANGMQCSISTNSNDIYIWGYNENGVRTATKYNDMNSGGFIDINCSYYAG